MIVTIIYTLILGAVAGWIANTIMKKDTSRLGKNIILGIAGSIVGGRVGGLLGLTARSALMGIVFAVAGACLVIFLVDKFVK